MSFKYFFIRVIAFFAIIFPIKFVHCDSIIMRGMYSYHFHLEYFEMDEFNDIYLQNKPIPGIGQFYHSNGGYSLEASYIHPLKRSNNGWIFTGGYSHHELDNEIDGVSSTFGEELDIHKLYFLGGLINEFNENKCTFHLSLGPVLNFYKGLTDYDYARFEFDYKTSITFRVNMGIERIIISNFYGNIGLSYEYGKIRRDNLNLYLYDEWIATFEPTDELWIKDDQILLSFGLSYKYSWGD